MTIGLYADDGSYNVTVVDSTPGVGATDLGKAEDAAHAGGDTGIAVFAVRQDTLGTPLATTTGDYIPLITDAFGALVTGPDGLAVGGTATSAATLFTQDMLGYESITTQVTSAGSACTITYETSEDQSTWFATLGLNAANVGASVPSSTSTTAVMLQFSRRGRYFRARVSTYGSGTVTIVGSLSKTPVPVTVSVAGLGTNAALSVRGPEAHDAAVNGNPLRVAARGLTANYTAVTTGDVADLVTTLVGALIQKPYAIPELDWTYAAASGGIVDTSDNVLKAAGAAGIRNYLTWIDLINTDTTVGTEVVVKDGSTVIWRTFIPASIAAVTQPMPVSFNFPTPLRGTAATALNVACITTSSQTYVNAGGYQAP